MAGAKADDFSHGESVLCLTNDGSWIPCTVLKIGPVDLCKITYDGWGEAYDEAVEISKLKLKRKKVDHITQLPVGTKIQSSWYGSWYNATVIGHVVGIALVHPDGYPQGFDCWAEAHEIKKVSTTTSTSEKKTTSSKTAGTSLKYNVGETIEVKGNNSNPWLPAKVVEVGPKRVFRVTYPGWSNVYDEYVGESQCQLPNGASVTRETKVKVGDQLNCLWGDGTRYPAKVLHLEEGIVRVLKQGYPSGYEVWVVESEIKGNTPADTPADPLQAIIQSTIDKTMAGIYKKAEAVKISTEIPEKQRRQKRKTQQKDTGIWKQILSSASLLPESKDKVQSIIKNERRPPWAGKPLLADTFHACIAASREDQPFADCIAKVLSQRGLKVTTESEKFHDSRVFIVIYSDDANRDENIVRHLTRAAERFNMSETIIVPIIRHFCTPEVIDHVPDNLAYSLSNTVMFNFDLFAEPIPRAIAWAVDDVEGVIRNYAEEKQDYNISGLWLCQAIVDSDVSKYSYIKEFTIFLSQTGNKITGTSVDGFNVSGTLNGRLLELRLTYRGKWIQSNLLWEENDYGFAAEIVAVVQNHGYRLEGDCVMVSDAVQSSSNENNKKLKEVGPFNATLEKNGLSGLYHSYWYSDTSYEEDIAIVHRGGKELTVDFQDCFGVVSPGFYDNSTGNIFMNFCESRLHSATFLGKLTKDTEGSAAIQCFYYSVDNGMTGEPHNVALTRDAANAEKEGKTYNEEENTLLTEMYNLKPDRGLDIPFKAGHYSPLSEGNFAVVICCTQHESVQALALKNELENVQQVGPVSVDFRDAKSKTRTIVLLLSQYIQEVPALIETISAAADQEIPIFNIGLDSWFNIFGEERWKNAELRLDLMNALARLNQTPESTLDPFHPNFRGLVKGIRKHTDPPIFYLSGLWGVEIISGDPCEKIARYSDLDDSSLQTVNRPSMIFLYFNHLTNELIMGSDYLVQNLRGSVDPETYTINMHNDVGKYKMRINEEMDKMYGTYWSERAQKEYRMLLTRAEGAVSGVYRLAAELHLTGIIQVGKSVASVMFGGYILPAMIDKNQLIFTAPVPLTPNNYITYVGRIALAPDGNYLAGYSFQSKVMQPRFTFDALQYTMRMQRVDKEGTVGEPDPLVVNLVETCWKKLEENDFEGYLEILNDDAKQALTAASFEATRLRHLRLEGHFKVGSLVFLGSVPLHQMGKPINATRYDFKMDFEKLKGNEFAVMIEDKTKKVATVASYEEEAETMHATQYDIMISYRSWDARFIDLLQAFLESKGFSVWRDRRMEVGVNWSEDITRAVRRSSCVLAAISENYLASVLCTKEVRMADDMGRPVIPLILPETCAKDDPRTKLVSSHYKEKHLPHTIANELSQISWCDMRPYAQLEKPDPVDAQTFGAKYKKILDSVLMMVRQIVAHSKVLDLNGDWCLDVGVPSNQYSVDMVIVSSDGSSIEGVLSSDHYGNVDIPIDKRKSWCHRSHLRVVATLIRGKQNNTIIIDAKVAACGSEMAGTFRFHTTPWEYPEGVKMDPLQAIGYKEVTNDSTVYTLRGKRIQNVERVPSPEVPKHFVLDMERAMNIVKDAYTNLTTEVLETNVVQLLKNFQKYDTDRNHSLDMKELELALRVANMNVTEGQKEAIMSELDLDASGTVDFYEFLQFISKVRKNQVSIVSPAAQVVKKGFVTKVCTLQ